MKHACIIMKKLNINQIKVYYKPTAAVKNVQPKVKTYHIATFAMFVSLKLIIIAPFLANV